MRSSDIPDDDQRTVLLLAKWAFALATAALSLAGYCVAAHVTG